MALVHIALAPLLLSSAQLRGRLFRAWPQPRPHKSNGSAPRVLIVLHQEHSTPGRVGRLLKTRRPLDIRRPSFGDPLPQDLADHAGAVIFGGPMSANDQTMLKRRDRLDRRAAEGGQAVPRPLPRRADAGAAPRRKRVYTHPDGQAEIGYYPVMPTEAGQRVCGCALGRAASTNGIARASICRAARRCWPRATIFPVQAIRVGDSAFGFQFHPEVTYAMMCRWTVRGHERMTLPGAFPRHQHLRDWFSYDPAVARWLDCFLTDWVAGRAVAGPHLACEISGRRRAPIEVPAAPALKPDAVQQADA